MSKDLGQIHVCVTEIPQLSQISYTKVCVKMEIPVKTQIRSQFVIPLQEQSDQSLHSQFH